MNKLRIVVGALAVFALACIWLAGLPAAHGDAAAAANAYNTEVTIQPIPGKAGAYLCKALVKRLDTGQVAAAPALKVPAGERAEAESAAEGSAERFVFRVEVHEAAGTAAYSIALRGPGDEIVLHRATVGLAKPAA